MLDGIKAAEQFRATLFATRVMGKTIACFRGNILGIENDENQVIEKALAYMAIHGVKNRRVLQIKGRYRKLTEVDR